MKKSKYLFLLPVVAFLFGGLLQGCGDNDDFSKPHYLTDEEIAEMKRQQDYLDSMRNVINADIVLEYTVEAYPSTQWDAKTFELDFTPVAEVFGLTVDQVISGINQAPEAPAIEGFAIQGTTHADYLKGSNTNGAWGHWWRNDGDVAGSYDEDASRFYCEWAGYYDEEKDENVESYFNIGQFPGRCNIGDSFTVLEGLKYQEKRVVFQITYKIIERGAVVAGVVNTQEITLDMTPNNTYAWFPAEFDLNRTLSDLSVSSLDGLDWIGLNADGSYAQEYTADAPGFWFDKQGFVGSWGDDASVFATYVDGANTPNVINVGQMPEQMKAGDVVTIQLGVTNGTQIEMFKITCVVEAYQDPETRPEGDPCDLVETIEFTKPWTEDYAAVDQDVRDILRDAFKMTTYEIFTALNNGDLKVYVGDSTDEDPTYTGGAVGENWLDADGLQTDYGNGYVYTGIDASEEYLYLYAGNHPQIDRNGGTVNYKLTLICNGGSVVFNVKFVITPVVEE